MDEILQYLLNEMHAHRKSNGATTDNVQVEDQDYALDALQRIMQLKSRVVLPYLVPHLTQAPVNIKALARLTLVAGEALAKHLSRIIQAVVNHLADEKDSTTKAEHMAHAEELITAVR